MSSSPGRRFVRSSCALALALAAPLMVGPQAQAADSAVSGSTVSASTAPVPSPSFSTSYRPSGSEFSLTVSPTRLVLGPADLETTAAILVVNRGTHPVSVTVSKRNFTGGMDGSLAFQAQAAYSASDWVTVTPTAFTIAPGASQSVSAVVTVPPQPEPGDHQVALVFMVPAGKTTANIRINRGVATPVYITVPGPTDNSVVATALKAPGFMMWGTTDVTATLRSTGTVHRDFRGTSPLLLTSAGASTTFPDFTVIRGATREVTTTWDPPLFCLCHPTVSVLNAAGVVSSVDVLVVVLPLHLLALGVVMLIVLLLALRIRRRRAAGRAADQAELAAARLRPAIGT